MLDKANAVILLAFLICAWWALAAGRTVVSFGDPLLYALLVAPPALFALLLLAGLLFARPATRTNIALLSASLLIGLFAANALVGVARALRGRSSAPPAQAQAQDGDRRPRREVVTALRDSGELAYVTIPANVLRGAEPFSGLRQLLNVTVGERRVVPLANITRHRLVYCNESGEYAIFTSDERGFNNPPGLWEGPLQVAALGDSFIQGSCVSPDSTITAHLRTRFPATVAVGVDGNGPLSLLASLVEYVAPAKPPIVLWFYFEGNDLGNLAEEQRDPMLRAYLAGDARPQGLVDLAPAIDSTLIAFVEANLQHEMGQGRWRPPELDTARAGVAQLMLRQLHLHELRSIIGLSQLQRRSELCCRLALFDSVLVRARDIVASWNGTLYFVYLPSVERYFGFPISHLRSDELRARPRVLEHVRQLGLPVIDIHEAFMAEGDPRVNFTHRRSHYNARGYALTARTVLAHLLRE